MTTKLFEIRDTGTTIPVMATALAWRDDAERWLLQRGGYSDEQTDAQSAVHALEPYVILWPLTGGVATYDPFGHQTSARTYQVAHRFIIEHWRTLQGGEVIDVEFILGERKEPKISERLPAGWVSGRY